MTVPVEHLYVHVPFCALKCKYCAFYSEAGDAARMGDYVTGVLDELARSPAVRPRTIFVGGGTPSLLPLPHLQRLLEGIRSDAVEEWTVECNPATVSDEKARRMREVGVNRISLGVQALDDAMLAVIGRIHSCRQAVESYRRLRAAGVENINLDLMFGLPGQTPAHWAETLRRAIELEPDHISTYCLTLEEDTEFWRLFQQGHLKPNDEQERAMYETALDMLATAGYRQYEVSNFAQPGRQCRHNIAYWEGRDYLGLGPSACSTIGDRRWQNTADLTGWRRAAEERLTPELRAAERAAFGMRMTAGVPAAWLQGRWDKQIAALLAADLVQWRDGRLQPTRRGILFADEIAAEFV